MSKSSSEVAASIFKQCNELCDQALNADLDLLAHLLSMAMLQAAQDMKAAALDGHSHNRSA